MWRYWQTILYLAVAGAIWFAEDILFTRAFGFGVVQTFIVTAYYVALFVAAIVLIVRMYRVRSETAQTHGLDLARVVALAPMLVVILGSFLALPVLMLVVILSAAL